MIAENSIVDYAMPLMVIEKLAKEVHNKCLKHQYKEAQELALKLEIGRAHV